MDKAIKETEPQRNYKKVDSISIPKLDEIMKNSKQTETAPAEFFISGNSIMKNNDMSSSHVATIVDRDLAQKIVIQANAPDVSELVEALKRGRMEIEEMYKRLGFTNSNVLEQINAVLTRFESVNQKKDGK